MNDPVPDQYLLTQKWIMAADAFWRQVSKWDTLGIAVRHKFLPGYGGSDDDPDVIAETKGFWQYRDFSITWYLPAAVRLDQASILQILVHEYVHVMNNSLESLVSNSTQKHSGELQEFATQTVANLIFNLLPDRGLDHA